MLLLELELLHLRAVLELLVEVQVLERSFLLKAVLLELLIIVKDRTAVLEVAVMALPRVLVQAEVMAPVVVAGLLVQAKALPPGNSVNLLVSYMPEVAEPEQIPPLLL